jgi:tyrosine-protein kinase Etk/Wzc
VETQPIDQVQSSNPSVELKKILLMYYRKWYLFIISFFLFFFLTFIYLRYKTPMYQIRSILLIREENNASGGSQMDFLNELGLGGSNKNVRNEIQILSSRSLMDSIVKQLNLTTSYYLIGNVRSGELYNLSPISVQVQSLNKNAFLDHIVVNHIDKTKFLISDKYGERQYVFGERIERPYGVFTLSDVPVLDTLKWKQIRIVFSSMEAVSDEYLARLNVSEADAQSSVLEIKLLEPVPQKGIDIISRLISLYQKTVIDDKNEVAQQTINFIDGQLKYITGDLSSVENNIENYKKANEITDISSEAGIVLNSINQSDKEISDINIKNSLLKYIYTYLKDDAKKDSLVPSPLGIDDPTMTELIVNYNRLQLQKDRLIKSTGPDNPLIGQMDAQLNQIKIDLLENINNLLSGIAIAKSNLENTNSEFNNEIKSVPAKERELIQITRQKEIKQNLYIYLIQKREESTLSLAATISNSKVIDSAYSSPNPVSPVRQLYYMLALFFGLIVPAAIIYFKDLFNVKVSSLKDIEEQTKIPVLGTISRNYTGGELVVTDKSRSAISEQFRLIRTNLEFLTIGIDDHKSKIILITSSMSSEGKSFFSINLGSSLALSGKKTVLVELDLRKPKLSSKLKLNSSVGITNYLLGNVGIKDIIKQTDIDPNLSIISCGPVPPNPGELLLNPGIKVMFNYLNENFDNIVIDSPPVGLVADALVISRFSDTTLYIVRNNFTYKHQVKIINDLQKDGRLANVAIIYNSISAKGRSYSYGYGYGYGYGYYEDEKRSKNIFRLGRKRKS